MTNQPITPSTNSISLKLLNQLSQEVLTPLTSILGMTSVLSQEIYGPLTPKQKEYVNILSERSRYLRSLVEEIAALVKLTQSDLALDRKAADVENLCQQAIASLEPEASRQQLKITLSSGIKDTANPESSGSRLLLLDKTVFQQMLQNLLQSVIYTADADTTIKFHLSRKSEQLDLGLWMSHPILGESLPHSQLYTSKLADSFGSTTPGLNRIQLTVSELATLISQNESIESTQPADNKSSDLLRLLLACQLLELQSGTLWIQGSPDLGYRYLLSFPVNNG
jgi:signal transduction histidine kinase